MAKLKPEDLERIAQKMKKLINLREGEARARVIVHMGTCGIAAGARAVMTAFMEEVEKKDLKDVILTASSCAGFCSREPMATIELVNEPAVKYVDLTPEKAKEIIEKHVIGGNIVKEYALAAGSERVL
ncbi:MAG: NADP oxidoreductase [Candidatus Omnitrophica bacterium CG11_big_fil_rev_8_21_14_0_20_42_13]|uniref:NADP oxidoreductase n=1 Tax=Candidatus Ghiorseimicrobium undicola TaxID=1974746 RepID=A0A2H0LYC8_9BACT|nr:MAG: NADP oxidoreductase [Candidatus Omnitrophica bacterium CG11_big_fil_rev_8_21_14_0_20_42_13]